MAKKSFAHKLGTAKAYQKLQIAPNLGREMIHEDRKKKALTRIKHEEFLQDKRENV